MFNNFDDITQFGATRFDAVTTATASTAKGLQAIAAESVEYSKRRVTNSYALSKNLLDVRKLDEFVELQSDFVKVAFQDFISQATKINGLYSELAKNAFGAAFSTEVNKKG
ncbi:hypothetical+protein [Methylocapsa aurea]|jgi:hypothetical protein|uniref:phasin family protein n=1 Tax=Methylocapsa aurea TaxID=663610 RepID=UPI003D18F855